MHNAVPAFRGPPPRPEPAPRRTPGRAFAVCASTCLAPAPCSPLLHLCTRIVLAPQAKEGFYALLDDSAELRGAPGRPKFSRARDLLELEPRWQVRRYCGVVLQRRTASVLLVCVHDLLELAY